MKRVACRMGGSSSTAKKAAEFLLFVVALLALTVPLFSQGAVGTILGAVFDSTGGAIAGAKVTITDVARGTTRVLTTDAPASLRLPACSSAPTRCGPSPRDSRRSNKATSCSKSPKRSCRSEAVARLDTQTVTVTEASPAINSTDSTLGGTVTNTSVASCPWKLVTS